jgi:hypothetical protein
LLRSAWSRPSFSSSCWRPVPSSRRARGTRTATRHSRARPADTSLTRLSGVFSAIFLVSWPKGALFVRGDSVNAPFSQMAA